MRMLASIFKALSDETRLRMLGLLLREGELCVCDFVEVLSVTQSKASRHLRYLVNAGLLQDRRAGIWVHFRVAEQPGPLQSAVLDGLRGYLPGQLPAELVSALKSWRKCKPTGALACAKAAAQARRRA
jgi:ArsR family transcriptional regulator, arsenate/arsenite/antimonite-responsive transcriptional repressor